MATLIQLPPDLHRLVASNLSLDQIHALCASAEYIED